MSITGYRDIGGLIGYVGAVGYDQVVENNIITNTEVIQNLVGGYQSTTPDTVHEVIGRTKGSNTVNETNNSAEVTISQITE